MSSAPLVTIAVPVYRRLRYLPGALHSVAVQDYPEIELIVSDNGENGDVIGEIVREHYPRPFRLRQTTGDIGITDHYNELVAEATGEYFVLLADDDELGPTFIADLVARLELNPGAGLALARLDVIDEFGSIVPRRSKGGPLPELLSGEDFIHVWCRAEYPFVCFTTFMARTTEVRAVGAYPPFPRGTSVDNALVIRLGLGRLVAFVPTARFRYRVYENSHGLSLPIDMLARDLRCFLEFLRDDPILAAYAALHPSRWAELRTALEGMIWQTYLMRWRRIYRPRMTTLAWLRAAFRLPFIAGYYWGVTRVLARIAARGVRRRLAPRVQIVGG